MKTNFDYVIIGAGIAGIEAARGIRSVDTQAGILLVNGENVLPYKRTRLSKELLHPFNPAVNALHPESWYAENDIILLNEKVNSLILKKKLIRVPSVGSISYGKLIIATGASPVLPPIKGDGKSNLLLFRNAANVQGVLDKMDEAEKILIVGGGSLGVELASVLSEAGKTVSLVHSSTSLLNHCFDEKMSFHLQEVMHNHGVRLLLQDELRSVSQTGNDKLLASIGEMIHLLVDKVIVAVGVKPNIELANKAGIKTAGGIVVNQRMETSVADVYAAGDVVQTAENVLGGLWHQAENQGWIAGVNAAGGQAAADGRKFRLKLEVFGHYYFALNIRHAGAQPGDYILSNNGNYLRFTFDEGRLSGAVMINLKPLAKQIEQAVNQAWSVEQVKTYFSSL